MGCHHDHCYSVSTTGTQGENDLQNSYPGGSCHPLVFTILMGFPPLLPPDPLYNLHSGFTVVVFVVSSRGGLHQFPMWESLGTLQNADNDP